jgi:hypothetical protein
VAIAVVLLLMAAVAVVVVLRGRKNHVGTVAPGLQDGLNA